MARTYEMVGRRTKVEETRRRIAAATYELHSTVGPAQTTVSLIAEKAGLPRQTVYRNFPTQLALFRGCIAFGLELSPPPDPAAWEEIDDPSRRLLTGLRELFTWFEAVEPVMTNSIRDMGALPAAIEAMQPLMEMTQRMHQTLAIGFDKQLASPLIRMAIDFSTWKMLRRFEGMESEEVLRFWQRLLDCRQKLGG
jgi:AcrR family transcriptional regulator